jgi:hypothetical protein
MLKASDLTFLSMRDAETKYPVATAKIEKMYNASEVKMDRWYGGNLARLCKIKDMPIWLMVSSQNKTIDIAIDPNSIKITELRTLAKDYDINTDATRKKDDILRELATKL